MPAYLGDAMAASEHALEMASQVKPAVRAASVD
jgi:hypothetical protein